MVEINHALGVKIERGTNGEIRLSQKAYVDTLLEKYNMQECRGAATPLEPGVELSAKDNPTSSSDRGTKIS